jgi:hypothetical protein
VVWATLLAVVDQVVAVVVLLPLALLELQLLVVLVATGVVEHQVLFPALRLHTLAAVGARHNLPPALRVLAVRVAAAQDH